ncbi:MAG: GTP-binding protein, partial [Lachnospiraceae bacterium]|nr:GTP-binding protein [Lachnospiraceae bacterium]
GTIYIFDQIYLGKKTFQDIDWVKNVLESKLSTEVLEKIKKLLGTADGESDTKKLAKMILDALKSTKK